MTQPADVGRNVAREPGNKKHVFRTWRKDPPDVVRSRQGMWCRTASLKVLGVKGTLLHVARMRSMETHTNPAVLQEAGYLFKSTEGAMDTESSAEVGWVAEPCSGSERSGFIGTAARSIPLFRDPV